MRPTSSSLVVGAVVAALAALAAPAHAASRRTVLKIDGERIYVDVGATDGVKQGAELKLFHAITATHPVTKKKVRDTFYLGTLKVLKVGKHLAVASAPAEFRERIQPGDEIELAGEPQVVLDPWEERARGRTADTAAPTDVDTAADEAARRAAADAKRRAAAQAEVDEAAAARAVWEQTLGKPIPERVALWTAYVNGHPESPYVGSVRDEIASLTAQENIEKALTRREQGGPDEGESTLDAPYLFGGGVTLADPLAFAQPTRVYEGSAFELSFLVVRPAAVRAAWVHYRRHGDTTYRSLELPLDGDGYLRARLPGHDVRPPQLDYFVEVQGTQAEKPVPVVGNAGEPATILVDRSVAEPPRDTRYRSRVTLTFDFVDFDSDNHLDEYIEAAGDFLYRFRAPIYAMRLGFATLRGAGGPKDVIDAAQDAVGGDAPSSRCRELDGGLPTGAYRCHRVAFTYTYVELEFHLTDIVAIMPRLLYGSSFSNPDPDAPAAARIYEDNFGANLRLRLGRERETNLALGVGAIQGFGKLFEAAFTWDVIRQFPIVISAQVTDQPVPEDYGVRLILDVGYRGPSWLYPSLRVSYAARDIDHAGVGVGGALNFDW